MSEINFYAAQGVSFEDRCALAREFLERAQEGMQPMLDNHIRHVDKARRNAEERAKQIPGAAEAIQKMYESRKHILNEHVESMHTLVWGFAIETARDLYGSDAVDSVLKDVSQKGGAN